MKDNKQFVASRFGQASRADKPNFNFMFSKRIITKRLNEAVSKREDDQEIILWVLDDWQRLKQMKA